MLDPQGDLDVGFKPSKKMKKRRELDALVGSGKARRKTKNGHELLRTESDSSEVDEFLITDRKKLMRQGRVSCCSTCMSVFGFFMVVTCFVFTGALLYMHFQMKESVEKIREEVNTVKGHSLQTTMDDLQHQIQNDIKKALVNVTKSPQEIEAIKQRMTTLTSKVDTLSTAIAAVGNSQPGSKQIVNEVHTLTTQVPVISKTVANLGVDVKTMKSTVDELINFKKNVEKELAEIKLHQNMESVGGGRESGRKETSHVDLDTDMPTKIQKLGDMIQLVNNSLWSELPKIQSKLSSHEVYLSALQNITANLQKDLTSLNGDHSSIIKDHKNMGDGSREGTEQTKVLIHQVIQDMGLANQTSPSISLDNISLKVDDITATVGALKSQFKLMKESQDGHGLTDADSIKTSLQALNQSVEVLKADFHTLMSKVTKQSNAVTKLTKTVEVLQHFSALLDKDHRNMLAVQTTTSTPSNPDVKTTAIPRTKLQPEPVPTRKLLISTTVAPEEKKSESLENKPPQAITDGHLSVVLPVNELLLSGVNSTDDKNIMLYHWEIIDGPTTLHLAQPDEAITTATGNIVAGQYTFELQVWDEENLTSKTQLTVDVKDKDSGDSVKSTATSISSTTPTPELHKYINMSLVKTYKDLDLGVRRWDKDGDGLVNAQDLQDYMPDPPSSKQLEKFDFNHDGLYSIDELAVALGFQPWPKDQPEPVDEEIH